MVGKMPAAEDRLIEDELLDRPVHVRLREHRPERVGAAPVRGGEHAPTAGVENDRVDRNVGQPWAVPVPGAAAGVALVDPLVGTEVERAGAGRVDRDGVGRHAVQLGEGAGGVPRRAAIRRLEHVNPGAEPGHRRVRGVRNPRVDGDPRDRRSRGRRTHVSPAGRRAARGVGAKHLSDVVAEVEAVLGGRRHGDGGDGVGQRKNLRFRVGAQGRALDVERIELGDARVQAIGPE